MDKQNLDTENHPLQKETYLLNGIAMEIHKILGRGFLEIVYQDALELELKKREIPFTRDKEFSVNYKGVILPHKFHADFVVLNDIIVEVRSEREMADERYSKMLNVLAVSSGKIGLIYNFGEPTLVIKRVTL